MVKKHYHQTSLIMNSKTTFLSHFLSEQTPGYGGSSGFSARHTSKISEGAGSNSQEWVISNHIGTHIDLSAHFDDKGKRLETFPSDDWVFNKPHLININPAAGDILVADDHFKNIPLDADFLIIKTGFEKHRNESLYWSSNPGLSPELAIWLRKERPNLKCLGFDFISITSYLNRPLGRIAHKAFLGVEENGTNPLRVIEDMKLSELTECPKQVVVAPILVKGADGAPVTVIALF